MAFSLTAGGTLPAEPLAPTPPGRSELYDLLVRPAWHADAACREHPEVNFFPGRGEPVAPAKAICSGCLVRGECADAVGLSYDTYGVWGGRTEYERKALRRPFDSWETVA